MTDRIQLDRYGLDEFVCSECVVHIERMDRTRIWIGIDKGDKHVAMMLESNATIRVLDQDGTFGQWNG